MYIKVLRYGKHQIQRHRYVQVVISGGQETVFCNWEEKHTQILHFSFLFLILGHDYTDVRYTTLYEFLDV